MAEQEEFKSEGYGVVLPPPGDDEDAPAEPEGDEAGDEDE
jgi:hypothetical protein